MKSQMNVIAAPSTVIQLGNRATGKVEYREELQERDGLLVRILPYASVMAVTLVATRTN